VACRQAANGLNFNIPTMHVDMAWIDVQDAGSIPAASTIFRSTQTKEDCHGILP